MRSFHCSSVVTNLTSIHEDVGSIPGLAQWVKDPVLLCRLQMQLGSHVAVAVVQAGSCSSDSTPRLGPSTCGRCSPKRTKKKKKKKRLCHCIKKYFSNCHTFPIIKIIYQLRCYLVTKQKLLKSDMKPRQGKKKPNSLLENFALMSCFGIVTVMMALRGRGIE